MLAWFGDRSLWVRGDLDIRDIDELSRQHRAGGLSTPQRGGPGLDLRAALGLGNLYEYCEETLRPGDRIRLLGSLRREPRDEPVADGYRSVAGRLVLGPCSDATCLYAVPAPETGR